LDRTCGASSSSEAILSSTAVKAAAAVMWPL
jgi:hypothetical protein